MSTQIILLQTLELQSHFLYCRSGTLDFDDFLLLMANKIHESDIEIHYKDTFRAFSKDDDGKHKKFKSNNLCFTSGCIPAEELKFVMNHLPGKVGRLRDIDEMIKIVDRNGDGRISYSEFRY